MPSPCPRTPLVRGKNSLTGNRFDYFCRNAQQRRRPRVAQNHLRLVIWSTVRAARKIVAPPACRTDFAPSTTRENSFRKLFAAKTATQYRRRSKEEGGFEEEKRTRSGSLVIDNRWIVPHNRSLQKIRRSHQRRILFEHQKYSIRSEVRAQGLRRGFIRTPNTEPAR